MNLKKKKIILNTADLKKNEIRIKIYSKGGQGIRGAVSKLEKSLENRQDLFFTSLVKYDGIIKGGAVEANIVISKKKKTNPFFEKADFCVFLTEIDKKTKCEKTFFVKNIEELDILKKVFG